MWPRLPSPQCPNLSSVFVGDNGVQPNNILGNHVSFHFGKLKFIIGTHEKINGKSKDKYRMMINFEVDNIYKSYNRLKSFELKLDILIFFFFNS